MSPGRNQPCPCGSGRKYKHCCGSGSWSEQDRSPLGRALPPELLEFARGVEVWQADVVALPAKVSGAERSRMVTAMVVAEDVVVENDVQFASAAEPEDVAGALERALSSAAESVGVWPTTVTVRREEVAEVLGSLLRERGCRVEVAPQLVGLDPLARDLASHLSGREGWPTGSAPETWAGWGLPGRLVKELFRGYAAYYRAAPWRWLDDVPPIAVEWDDGTGPWIASVMGAGLGEFGLAVHSRPEDFQDLLDQEEDALPFQAVRGWVVHLGYYHRRELPRAMLKEISRAGWEVEAVGAYPYILPILTAGGGLQRELVRRLTQILHGVAALAEEYGPRLRAPEGGVFTWTEGDLILTYAVAPDGELPRDSLAPGLPDLAEEIRQAGLETEEEIQAHLASRVGEYNATPQEELGGISPDQAQALIIEGMTGEGHLRFAEDLSLEELEASAFLANARLFLDRLAEAGGIQATQAGNLKRVFVAEILESMRLPDGYLERLHRGNRVVNEDDVWPLHVLRVNLEIAGLIKLRKGVFSITKRGRELAAPEAAGRLFAHLFRTYFGEFNLEYGSRGFAGPNLQPAVPILLWQIGVRAQNWISVGDLARLVLPGRSGASAPDEGSAWTREASDFEYMLLNPLRRFGLLEERQKGEAKGRRQTQESTQIRTTSLFKGFLRFDWD
jgi:hypothetical protein